MYLLSGDDADSPGLFLAPALTTTVEAPPMEQVQFIRDEMANMVWAKHPTNSHPGRVVVAA